MPNPDLNTLKTSIGTLSAEECLLLGEALKIREKQVENDMVMERRAHGVKCCRHCGSMAFVRWGSKDGRQRFKCREPECGRTFNAMTGTPLARLHKTELHLGNAECMMEGMTVRKTATVLGVSKNTAFLWRHRFLATIRRRQPGVLSGIVEADETFFPESFKGSRHLPPGRQPKKRGTPANKPGLSVQQIPVLVARDRSSGETLSTRIGSTSARDIGVVILPRLARDAELISDGARAYGALAKQHGLNLRVVPKHRKHKTVGSLHVNNVNAYDSRLKSWMDRFKGVATKYLENYLGWHRLLESDVCGKDRTAFLAAAFG